MSMHDMTLLVEIVRLEFEEDASLGPPMLRRFRDHPEERRRTIAWAIGSTYHARIAAGLQGVGPSSTNMMVYGGIIAKLALEAFGPVQP